jgi:hypothetical protein
MATLRYAVPVAVAAVSAVLTGCEPSPGKVLDARTVNAGPLELQVRLRAERHWMAIPNGQYFELDCRERHDEAKSGDWWYIGVGRSASSQLRSAPVERVATDDSGFFLTDLLGGATFSFGSCRDHHAWIGKLPERYAALNAHRDILAHIREVHFCPGGPQLSMQIVPEAFTDHRIVWVTTRDAGTSWEASEGSSPALRCPGESERRRVLGSH